MVFFSLTILSGLSFSCLSATSSAWERIGPRNIFDDKTNRGESGTLADAASPVGNPNLIYAGGSNNGASSGIIKSVDKGVTWQTASNGLYDTRVYGVYVVPDDPSGSHVYAGTPSGIYESVNGAASWKYLSETQRFGLARSFRNGTINGEQYVFVGTSAGIATKPVQGGAWNLIVSPKGQWLTPMSVALHETTSVVAGCLGGVVWLGTVRNATTADFTELPAITCAVVAIDPNNKDHFLYSNATGWQTWESTDGGQTVHNLHHPTGSFYVAIDRQGWYYTGAEAGAYRSMDGGKTWQAYVVNMVSRANYTNNRVPHDFQRISLDFAGSGVAFPSDQGLFIKPPGTALGLVNACGNMSNNIAITVAVSQGAGAGAHYLVLTIWDWAPIASWDAGKHWPATPCAYWDAPGTCDGAPSTIGEGGAVYALGTSNHVVMLHYHTIYHSAHGGQNMTRVVLPSSANDHSSVLQYTRAVGSRYEPAGDVYTVMTMAPSDNWRSRDDDDDKYLKYMVYGEQRDVRVGGPWADRDDDDTAKYVLKSPDFGVTWNWTVFPAHLQAVTVLAVDPTDATTLYAIAPNCVATSVDKGETWAPCLKAPGLTGSFTSLIIKNSHVMILLRNADVPLRTKDGGTTWAPLSTCANISAAGYTRAGSYSWSGNTLVLHGRDNSAPMRGAYAAYVWKSVDDGDTWADETGDLVTMAPNEGVWFHNDFYLTSSGEGILAKRNFDV